MPSGVWGAAHARVEGKKSRHGRRILDSWGVNIGSAGQQVE